VQRKPIFGHCNDKMLVAYSDDELGTIRLAATRRHLAVCRRCLARQANLKCIVWRIRRLLAKRSCFDVIRTEEAKKSLLRWRDNFEMLRLTEPSNPSNG
jgi:anti-sigma factor RsiW